MVSLRARILLADFRLTRQKRVFADLEKLYESIAKSQKAETAEVPKWVGERYRVTSTTVDGWPCHTVRPHDATSGRHVLHLHGGAYIHELEPEHWVFLTRLADYAGCAVSTLLYPLAPKHHYDETISVVRSAYDQVLGDLPAEDRILAGDSAGGGLALGLGQWLAAEHRPQPKEILLISPWLDLTMTDPGLPELDEKDPFLSVPGLLEAGRLYADELDPRDPLVSPLFGELTGLAPLSVFIGTRDVLLVDSRRLRDEAARVGVAVEYHEYPGMFHTWILDKMREAKHATEQMARIVRRPPERAAAPPGASHRGTTR